MPPIAELSIPAHEPPLLWMLASIPDDPNAPGESDSTHQPARFECKPPLCIGAGKRALQKHGTESLVYRQLDCGTMPLLPAKPEAGIRTRTNSGPADGHLTARIRERAMFDRIGRELVQQQRECLHVPAVDAQIGTIQHDALRISRKLGGDDLLD